MNDGKAILSTSSKHTIWDNDLNNPFNDIDYSLLVLDDKLHPFFAKYDHPTAILITKLLTVTSGFLHTTEFAQSSAESKNEKDLNELFNTIAVAFQNLQNANLQKSTNPHEQTISAAAINYCKILIVQELSQLQKLTNNKIYNFYHNHCGELQKILSNINPDTEYKPSHTKHLNK